MGPTRNHPQVQRSNDPLADRVSKSINDTQIHLRPLRTCKAADDTSKAN